METPKIKRLEQVTVDGKNVFRSWLRRLKDTTARARIRVRLNRIRLENLGDCKPIGEGVTECRIDYGPGYCRVYFGQHGNTVVILLSGGTKKSQSKDIKLAQEYWADYQRRTK